VISFHRVRDLEVVTFQHRTVSCKGIEKEFSNRQVPCPAAMTGLRKFRAGCIN